MDTAASVLGIASAPYALVQTVNSLWEQISNLHSDNPERILRLKNLAEALMEKLRSGETVSHPALILTQEALQSVRRSLDSITQRHAGHISDGLLSFFTASGEHVELVEAERTLESLLNQVVVVESVFQLVPTIGNEIIEFPVSQVGLDRGSTVLDFLRRSQSEDLRVIAIHGQPGVGKTTILNYVWERVAWKAPFGARAYMQIGHDATPQTICKSQTNILWQLCNRKKEFPSSDFGRGELNKSLKELKAQKRPLFLAIDNVFRPEDLEALLPAKLGSENLPTSSCIAVTCRNFTIVETLLNICRLQEHRDHLRVFCFEPPYLDLEESRRVFVECAGMDSHSASEHGDLLDALVPLCGGLPLALTVLGKTFVDERRRERQDWQRVEKQWAAFDDGDANLYAVRRALELSFEMLHRTRQLAFLDIVSSFYGWGLERVERIVGVSVMRDLIKSSLVWKVDHHSKCNQNAIREGYWFCDFSNQGYEEFISMHDLTLKFGENLIYESTLGYSQFVNKCPRTNFPKASSLRMVHLASLPCDHEFVLNFLRSATHLQMLYFIENSNDEEALIVRGSSCKKKYLKQGLQQLQCLRLHNCISSRSIMEMKVTREIKEIVLYKCHDIEELPNTALQNLERLKIQNCSRFQGFSASCVKEWCSLKVLTLDFLPKLTTIPMDLGLLPSLKVICVYSCSALEEFPSLRSSSTHKLELAGCGALEALGRMLCPLQTLQLTDLSILMFELVQVDSLRSLSVIDCSKLLKLPTAIANASSLQSLEIKGCPSLLELLPDEEIGNMTSLAELSVRNCESLKRLPALIFQKAPSLQRLEVSRCPGLVTLPAEIGTLNTLLELHLVVCTELAELPEQIEGLRSLKVLVLSGCRKLKKLPDSLCSIKSIERLFVDYCESLAELPERIGGLCSLKELSLRKCSSVRKFPEDIFCNMSSLEALDLYGSDHCLVTLNILEQMEGLRSLRKLNLDLENILPDSICSITTLKKLRLETCEKLKKLPGSIGCMSSLERLDVSGCESLVELPEQIGGLTSLRHLELCGCKKLEKLPDSIGNLSSLKFLMVDGCESVVELPGSLGCMSSLEVLVVSFCESVVEVPEQIGGLTSLRTLTLWGCKKLEKLPDSIGNLSSLESLQLYDWESLVEVPEQIGGLTSLNRLWLLCCKKLEKLPDSIGNLSSLDDLNLSDCESVVELPGQIGGLTSLRTLTLERCKKLEKLPDSIGNLSSLEKLELQGCESLVELPDSIGSMSSLGSLDVRNCKSLVRLPEQSGGRRLRVWKYNE